MKIIKLSLLPILFLLIGVSCSEEKLQPLNNDDSIPAVVKNIEVENLSGEVIISYSVPKGTSLLYVEAEVKMANGKLVKSKSSYYNNSLKIEGFGDSKEYEVKLYSVGRNLKRSEPITVKVNPLDPPIWNIFNSFEIVEDFGGMSIDFQNLTEAEVSVVVEVKDSRDEWVIAETFYTSQKEGQLTVRGLEAKLQTFRIFVNDRWGNQSEILNTELTPLYEEELDRSQFIALKLPNDPDHWNSAVLPFLLNDNLSGAGSFFRTDNGTPMPTQVTFDMGVTAKLSRFKFWQRGTETELELLYTAGSPRIFEIWGSNDPDPDGSYDSWVKLMDGELIKPSGLPIPVNSPEDIEAAVNGHEYIFPTDAPPVRYIRIKVLRTYGVTDYFWMSIIRLYGQPNN